MKKTRVTVSTAQSTPEKLTSHFITKHHNAGARWSDTTGGEGILLGKAVCGWNLDGWDLAK